MRIDYNKYIQQRIESNNKDILDNTEVNIFFGKYDNIINYDQINKILMLDKFINKKIYILSIPPRKILRRIFPIAYDNMIAIPPYALQAKTQIENMKRREKLQKNNNFTLLDSNENIINHKADLDLAIFTVGYVTSLASAFNNKFIYKGYNNSIWHKKLNNILILSKEKENHFDVRMILIGYLSSLGFNCIEINNIMNKKLENIYNISNRYSKKCCQLIYEQFKYLLPLTVLDNEFFHAEKWHNIEIQKLSNKQLIKAILDESGINYFLNQYKDVLQQINIGKPLPMYNDITFSGDINNVQLDKHALEAHQKLLFSRQSITAVYMQKLLNSIK